MKHLYSVLILCASLLCALNASALEFTLEWDIPGSVLIQPESTSGPYIELGSDQTSYTFSTDKSYGYCYVYAADGYHLTGAESTDGSLTFTPALLSIRNVWYVIGYIDSKFDGKTIRINSNPVNRNESFDINLQNGFGCVSAVFRGGFTLDLKTGLHSYVFDPEIDNPLALSFSNGVTTPYSVTLNGTEITEYSEINITAGATLDIRVFENDSDAPTPCTVTFEYAKGMEGCITSIHNWSNSANYYPSENVDNTLTVLSNNELQINLNNDDYSFTKVLLDGNNILSTFTNAYVRFKVTAPEMTVRFEGTRLENNMVTFTGYIVNGEGLEVRNTYVGNEFELPEGTAIEEDIVIDNITFPATTTRKYEISVPLKQNKFFFGPLPGWYITNVYSELDGEISLHSTSASMYAPSDGTTFYMILEKLPAEYSADLIIENSETDSFYFNMRGTNTLDGAWGNPEGTVYNTNIAEQTISFIPGYNTPIRLRAFGEENKAPGVYLDGVAVTQGKEPNSDAPQYLIDPYYPKSETDIQAKSKIVIYNSATQRPTMTGAILQLENGAEASFYYSDVMHKANPQGQAVIRGTSFTVVPYSPDMTVYYKNELVKLDDEGKYTFVPTGNARENIVKVTTQPAPSSVEITDKAEKITVYSIDGRLVIETTESNTLNTLDSGLYIVNGQKVLLRPTN